MREIYPEKGVRTMQNHPTLGDSLFAKEMLRVIDESIGLSAGPPSRQESFIDRMRRTLAAFLRKTADRVETQSSCNQVLVDCQS